MIRFRRNFGQTAAFAAGFAHARGRLIVTSDGDLQNDPRDIPAMVEQLEGGYDIVCGWRKDRKDAFVSRRLPSTMANGLISGVTGVHLHDYGCSLKVFRAEINPLATVDGSRRETSASLRSFVRQRERDGAPVGRPRRARIQSGLLRNPPRSAAARQTIQRSGLLRAYEVKAISAPPGEYAGSRLSEPIFVRSAIRPPSMSTAPISRWPRFSANAIREPNTPRLPVNDCTTSLAKSWTASRMSAAR